MSNKTQTVARPMRHGSLGLTGTRRNAEHHAKRLIPFIETLMLLSPHFGFAEWVQGHNVHEFVTTDGRRFTLRGYTRDGAYQGIRLSLRLSRSKEIFLMDAETMEGITDMVILMGKVAPGMLGNPTPLLAGNKSCS